MDKETIRKYNASEAGRAARARWDKKNIYSLRVVLPEHLLKIIEEAGYSKSGYIKDAILSYLDRHEKIQKMEEEEDYYE